MKPNIFVAGFPRCGSEFTARVLRQHPDINIPYLKEINYLNHKFFFFDKPRINTPLKILPLKWYYSLFKNKKIRIDMSIKAAYDKKSAKRIKKVLGDIPILFLIRDKKGHVKSMHKLMRRSANIPNIEYEEYIKNPKNKKKLEFLSDFETHIKPFKENFSNVKTFNIVDKDTKNEIKKILKFLKVKQIDLDLNKDKNTQTDWKYPSKLKIIKHKVLTSFPFVHKIIVLLRYFLRKEITSVSKFQKK